MVISSPLPLTLNLGIKVGAKLFESSFDLVQSSATHSQLYHNLDTTFFFKFKRMASSFPIVSYFLLTLTKYLYYLFCIEVTIFDFRNVIAGCRSIFPIGNS